MKKLFFLIKIILGVLIFFNISSCGTDDFDKDGVNDDKDKCPYTYAKTKDGCPLKEKQIGKIHFYIETSASNAGYFGAGNETEFRTILCDLTTQIDKFIKPININYIAETITPYTNTIQEFTNDIAKTKMATQNGYELHKMIKNIASKNDTNDVSLFVSDCILSFPDEDIKIDSNINKSSASSTLKSSIFSTFADLKKKGFATDIYAFNSKFYGTYYDYQNGKHEINGSKRPFYLLVIGNKEILGKFNTKLNEIPTFKPEKSLHFGLAEEPVSDYSIISQIESKGKWMKSTEGITDIEINKTESLQFCIALNLENLPEYAKEIKYLNENIQIKNNGCDIKFEVKEKTKVDKSKLKSEPQLKMFEEATHFIIIKVNSMALSEAKMNITLPLLYDTWYLTNSCMDDKNMALAEGKTFAFEYFIQGIKEAYETKNKNYIDFTLTLKK